MNPKRKKAFRYATKLTNEGHSEEEIGKILHKEGIWSSKQTGKPLQASGVKALLMAHKWPSHQRSGSTVGKSVKKTVVRSEYKKYKDIISPIIRLNHLNDSEKIALLQLLDEKLS